MTAKEKDKKSESKVGKTASSDREVWGEKAPAKKAAAATQWIHGTYRKDAHKEKRPDGIVEAQFLTRSSISGTKLLCPGEVQEKWKKMKEKGGWSNSSGFSYLTAARFDSEMD